jgi:hypothetical protein
MTVPNNANVYLPATPVTPMYFLITNITRSIQMQVTTQIPSLYILPANPNTYVVGQKVRLNVPLPYNMFQANGLTGKIISINDLVFTLDIDSTGFDTFVTPSSGQEQPASFSPAGSSNLQFSNNTDFVPFQSATTTGN